MDYTLAQKENYKKQKANSSSQKEFKCSFAWSTLYVAAKLKMRWRGEGERRRMGTKFTFADFA